MIQAKRVFPGNHEALVQHMEKTDAMSSSFLQMWGGQASAQFLILGRCDVNMEKVSDLLDYVQIGTDM